MNETLKVLISRRLKKENRNLKMQLQYIKRRKLPMTFFFLSLDNITECHPDFSTINSVRKLSMYQRNKSQSTKGAALEVSANCEKNPTS